MTPVAAETLRHARGRHVVTLAIDQLVAWGILYYAYALLFVPLAADVGVSRTYAAAAFSGSLFVSGLLARPVGRALDRLGARPVLLAGAAAGLVAMAALLVCRGPFTLAVAFVLFGVAQALALYESAFRAVVFWFPAARARSRALLVVTSVAGFASTVFLPLTAALLAAWGWRVTVATLGLLLAVVLVPLRLFLPGGQRPPANLLPAGAAIPLTGSRWLTAAFALHAFASTGVAVYLVWHLTERGWSTAGAAALAGLAGAAQVPGRLLVAPLQRALGSAHRLPFLFGVQAIALVALVAGSGVVVPAMVLLFGAASGMMTLERAAITVAWYGRDAFGARSGDLASAALLARAAAPYLVAVIRGTGGYAQAFVLLSAVMLVGGLAMMAAEHTRRTAGRS